MNAIKTNVHASTAISKLKNLAAEIIIVAENMNIVYCNGLLSKIAANHQRLKVSAVEC